MKLQHKAWHMTARPIQPDADRVQTRSNQLNRDCFCITLEQDVLCREIEKKTEDPEFCATYIRTRPNLFSNVPMFLSAEDIAEMLRVVLAIEKTARLPAYRDAVMSWALEIAHRDRGPLGAFMGYDFHLAASGAKLIEINTNAGGAFLNTLLIAAQRACCAEVEVALQRSGEGDIEVAILNMFQHEWSTQRKSGILRQVAIVDDHPEDQFLYPEFLLAQKFFKRHGIEAIVVDAAQLEYEQGKLVFGTQAIDLVYNRVVDFSLNQPEHHALRAAYLADAVVVTPNPHNHALFADKRNLILLSDQNLLESWGVSPETRADLVGVPRTTLVTPVNASLLWAERKSLFFKPAGGHGGKAVYRGDKVTKGVWAEISQGGYVAQEFAAPSERIVRLNGAEETRKADVRLYTYDGQLLLTAARLYQGQTTNFKTPGGGFAPVFAV
jgi:hypothetical protein